MPEAPTHRNRTNRYICDMQNCGRVLRAAAGWAKRVTLGRDGDKPSAVQTGRGRYREPSPVTTPHALAAMSASISPVCSMPYLLVFIVTS